jgi:hypothetical protein
MAGCEKVQTEIKRDIKDLKIEVDNLQTQQQAMHDENINGRLEFQRSVNKLLVRLIFGVTGSFAAALLAFGLELFREFHK